MPNSPDLDVFSAEFRRSFAPVSATETGRRIRAALALAGVTSPQVAAELNLSSRTLDRVIAGQRQARDWELRRLSELLDVPEWFLREGFAGRPSDEEVAHTHFGELRDEVRALDRKLDVELFDRLSRLEEELRQLTRSARNPR